MRDRIELYNELKQYLSQLSDRLDKGSQEYILELVSKIADKEYNNGWEEHCKFKCTGDDDCFNNLHAKSQ